jgi:hypothetical protein
MKTDKIRDHGCEFRYPLEMAVEEIIDAYLRGKIIGNPLKNPMYHNIETLKNESSLL